MAIELYEFLAGQLGQLPSDHPDRPYLEEVQEQTASFLARSQGSSLKARGGFLSKGTHIAKYFEEARVGPYLNPDQIAQMLTRSYLTYSTDHYGRILLEEIQRHGDNSAAHLCLPPGLFNVLKRNNLTTISQLEERVSLGGSPGRLRIPGAGSWGYPRLIYALNHFHQLQNAQEQTTEI